MLLSSSYFDLCIHLICLGVSFVNSMSIFAFNRNIQFVYFTVTTDKCFLFHCLSVSFQFVFISRMPHFKPHTAKFYCAHSPPDLSLAPSTYPCPVPTLTLCSSMKRHLEVSCFELASVFSSAFYWGYGSLVSWGNMVLGPSFYLTYLNTA